MKNAITKRAGWRKSYFFFITIISFFGLLSIIQESSGFKEYVSLVSSVIFLIGLFGFIYNKKIFSRKFWLFFIPIYFAWLILYQFTANIDLTMGLPKILYVFFQIGGWIISIPAFIGLVLYGLPSNELWIDSPN